MQINQLTMSIKLKYHIKNDDIKKLQPSTNRFNPPQNSFFHHNSWNQSRTNTFNRTKNPFYQNTFIYNKQFNRITISK